MCLCNFVQVDGYPLFCHSIVCDGLFKGLFKVINLLYFSMAYHCNTAQ
jgi:hypothetical protein